MAKPAADRLKLVVVQPTSLCNLNCRYCYVADRRNPQVMADRVLDCTIKQTLNSDLVRENVEFLWHAGEPLLAGAAFYRRAIDLQRRYNSRHIHIRNTIQTNGVLIDDHWCRFFKEHAFRVGVSLDGPEAVNDRYRVAWNGRGSFKRIMSGIAHLRKHEVSFGVLCVLTASTLSEPDTLYDFFSEQNFRWVGFNIEENEGTHGSSSIHAGAHEAAYTAFFTRLYDRWIADGRRFIIREFDDLHGIVLDLQESEDSHRRPDETIPLAIVTVARDGSFSTFSPELISTSSRKYSDFFIGHVERDSFDASLLTRRQELFSAVAAGIAKCRSECAHFAVCGGGYLSNRIVEHDDFSAIETTACRLHRQALSSVVLDRLVELSKEGGTRVAEPA